MMILASIGLVLLVAIAAAGVLWAVKTVRFNGNLNKESDDE